ncbi:hypothetical protein, partial [Aeromonas encheleia]
WHSPCESRTLPGTQFEEARSIERAFLLPEILYLTPLYSKPLFIVHLDPPLALLFPHSQLNIPSFIPRAGYKKYRM